MALLKLKQFRSNLKYNTGTNVLTVSGSLVAEQNTSLYPAMTVSGSFNVVDSPNISSGSFNVNEIDGGTF